MTAAYEPSRNAEASGQNRMDSAIPSIVAEAGDVAVAAYRAYLDAPERTALTRRAYHRDIVRFLRWASERGLTLKSLGDTEIAEYRAKLVARWSEMRVNVHLSPIRGLLRCLADAGVIKESAVTRTASRKTTPVAPGFDLLGLLAMLAFMEEASLRRIFDDEDTALSLLEQVRWPDEIRCPDCGEAVEDAHAADTGHRFRCGACRAEFTALTRTMFDGSPLALRHWVRLIHDRSIASETASDTALANAIGVEWSSVPSLCSGVQAAMDQAGIPLGDAFNAALKDKDRELVNNQFARNVIRYAELTAWRDTLQRAKAEGTVVDGLPAGMTQDRVLADLEAQIAEEDRWVWYLDDGYILGRLADNPAAEFVGPADEH